MVAVKVWLAGEGPSEIGDRDTGGERVGVLEGLLRRVEARGWIVDRASRWKDIRKYQAGSALRGAGDDRSVQRLVLRAYEAGCGGTAWPCIEGWVLALAGVKHTDEMSRPRCDRELAQRSIASGHAAVEAFVEIVEDADLNALPNGCGSLVGWLERARSVLPRAVHGSAADPARRDGA
jgi:hypothetical protein